MHAQTPQIFVLTELLMYDTIIITAETSYCPYMPFQPLYKRTFTAHLDTSLVRWQKNLASKIAGLFLYCGSPFLDQFYSETTIEDIHGGLETHRFFSITFQSYYTLCFLLLLLCEHL